MSGFVYDVLEISDVLRVYITIFMSLSLIFESDVSICLKSITKVYNFIFIDLCSNKK